MQKIFLTIISLVFLASCTLTPTTPTHTSGSTSGETQKMVDAPTYGGGRHTIEYFGDFQCPACIRFSHTLLPILEEFAASGQVNIVYKQFPLTTIHKNAYRDSIAALCVADQGKYMEYKKSLVALEEGKAGASVSDDERIAAGKDIVGLDTDKLRSCLENNATSKSVDRDMAEGDTKRINATPTLLLDGTKLDLGMFASEAMFREQMGRILAQ